MKTTCEFTNPDEMMVSMKMEMPLKQWREIACELAADARGYGPSHDLRWKIKDVIADVEKVFYAGTPPTTETPPTEAELPGPLSRAALGGEQE